MKRMRRPAPLPRHLTGQALTRTLLVEEGIAPERLYRADMTRISRGIHRRAVEELSAQAQAAALAASLPETCLSHVTAASALGLWLPPEVRNDSRIHLTQPAGTTLRIRRPGVVSHRRPLPETQLTQAHGVLTTTPARTWFDLSSACSVRHLVMLGDHLVRTPRPKFEGRSHPHATVEELRAIIDSAGKVRGKRRSREALELIRVGADSPPETALRLSLIEAGLPEPELQVPPAPHLAEWFPADLGYPRLKIAIQYDGEPHFSPERARWDQTRNNEFHTRDWLLLLFNRDDHRDQFRRAVRHVDAAIATRTQD